MGIFTKDIKTMEDLFLHQLEDIYYAEQQLTKAIPKMAEMATNADLKAGLKSHVIDTKNQIERLDKVFAKLGQKPKGTDCPAIDGLIKEADETAGEIEDKAVLDAAIVANSRAVEHYEISRRNLALRHAHRMGGRAWPRRRRPPVDDKPQRRKGRQHQAEYGSASQGREQESFCRVRRTYSTRQKAPTCSGPSIVYGNEGRIRA